MNIAIWNSGPIGHVWCICQNLAFVTGHNSFYQNAKSIKHVMVTRHYRIVQFTTVPNKWWRACFGHDHSLFSYHQYIINAGGEDLQWEPVPAQWDITNEHW